MQLKFYYCRHCGKIIAIVKDSGIPTVCCGEAMQELVPGTTDGSSEKHIPVIKVEGNTVSVTVAQNFIRRKQSITSNGFCFKPTRESSKNGFVQEILQA